MAYANLNRVNQTVDGFDSIIIVKDVADVPCGVALDVTDVTDATIKGGTVLIQKEADSSVKPLGITGEAYESLPSGYAYYGILKGTVLTASPMGAVLKMGVVNAAAAAKAVGAPYTDAIKTALKNIEFIY